MCYICSHFDVTCTSRKVKAETRVRLKLVLGQAKVPYYIEAYLLRSPYFMTLGALWAHTVFAQSGRFSKIQSHTCI